LDDSLLLHLGYSFSAHGSECSGVGASHINAFLYLLRRYYRSINDRL